VRSFRRNSLNWSEEWKLQGKQAVIGLLIVSLIFLPVAAQAGADPVDHEERKRRRLQRKCARQFVRALTDEQDPCAVED